MEYLSVVEYFFEEAPGGSGRVAWDIARVMRDRGYSVTMLFYVRDEGEPGVTEYDGIRLVRFHKERKPGWHPGRLQAITNSAAKACVNWLSDRQWDIVHIHTPLIGLGVISALGVSPRYVMTVHSPLVLEQEVIWRSQGLTGMMKLLLGRKALAKAERELVLAANKIHTLSEFTRNVLDKSYGVGNKVTVIPHWYEPHSEPIDKQSARKALGWPADVAIIFTVRGLGPRYGVDIAIRAFAQFLENKECLFYIGGRGPMREALESLAKELGAGENIRFLGRLSNADLELAYSAADLFILPTLALECFGLITVEALSFGCPVISSDAAAIPEIMRPILPDCVVPAGDVHALRDKIGQFLSGQLSLPDSNVLMAHARTHYGKEKIIPRYYLLFEG